MSFRPYQMSKMLCLHTWTTQNFVVFFTIPITIFGRWIADKIRTDVNKAYTSGIRTFPMFIGTLASVASRFKDFALKLFIKWHIANDSIRNSWCQSQSSVGSRFDRIDIL